MNYEETLEFLYAQLPMFSRIGAKALKHDLTNTLALCAALDNPQNKFKTIHVAGTNGKGSSSHMLAAILRQCGYKTGLYTSPHLYDFRERIKIDGALCSKEFVVEFVEKIQPQIAAVQPSFFEATVAMAFEYFARQKVDVAVIETGLGGRLDSTNIIHPELSLITNIGKDHTDILGDTLEKIAFEKAGIIKNDTPVVVSEYLPETKPVFEKIARSRKAPLILAQDIFKVVDFDDNGDYLHVAMEEPATGQINEYELDLTGIYQTKNILGVLAAVQELRKNGYRVAKPQLKKNWRSYREEWNIDEISVYEALKNVKALTGLHGRWERLSENPKIIADVAHNEDGIRQVIRQLQYTKYNRLHWIFGCVKDKDADAVLNLLPKDAMYYFTKAQIPRALNEAELANLAHGKNLHGQSFANIDAALVSVKENYQENDLILICGSIFLVAEAKIK